MSFNEARARALVETAVDGVILIDDSGIVITFNPACERLFGYAAAEVIGQNVKMLMPEPFRAEHDRYIGNYRTTGERKIIGIGRSVTGRRKNGSIFPMYLSVGEAREGDRSIFVGIIHDETEQKRTEQALADSAAQLRAIVDTAVDGVVLSDNQGTIQLVNPACEKLFAYTAAELIGQNVRILMPQPYHGEHDRYLDNYRTTGERKIIGIGREVVGRRKDGSTFPMDLSIGETTQGGNPMFVGVIHDLTSRKQIEEQLVQAQKMETVGQLSGGIAHDFNNLLTIIIGNAESLSEKLRVRPDLQQLSDSIVTAGERSAQLTQRLLAFSRRQVLQPAIIDSGRLINDVQRLLRRMLPEDIELNTAIGQSVPAVYADPAQLESALMNLVINARDALPNGGTITLSASDAPLDEAYREQHPEVLPGNYVMVSVTDDGIGMPPEILKRVFEPFFTTKEVGKGSGLGLSMVYGFAKQSNGHVSVYSEEGLGTTVRIYLPHAPKDALLADIASEPDPPPPPGFEAILIVEDDDLVRRHATSVVEALGYRVLQAADGREALEILQAGERPDLLFTDVVMPHGINGWELADKAEALYPGIKVIFTSGYPRETLAVRRADRASPIILNKPYHKNELARTLREVLGSPTPPKAPR